MNVHQQTSYFKFLETKLELINRLSEEVYQLVTTTNSLQQEDSYAGDDLTRETIKVQQNKSVAAYAYLERVMQASTIDELSDVEEDMRAVLDHVVA